MSAYPRNARGLRDGADPQDVEAYLASLVSSRVFPCTASPRSTPCSKHILRRPRGKCRRRTLRRHSRLRRPTRSLRPRGTRRPPSPDPRNLPGAWRGVEVEGACSCALRGNAKGDVRATVQTGPRDVYAPAQESGFTVLVDHAGTYLKTSRTRNRRGTTLFRPGAVGRRLAGLAARPVEIERAGMHHRAAILQHGVSVRSSIVGRGRATANDSANQSGEQRRPHFHHVTAQAQSSEPVPSMSGSHPISPCSWLM